MPMSLRAYLGGHLRNYMWRVETEASKVGQMGTQQAPTVVWSSSLPRCPSSQSGCRSCLIVTPDTGDGSGVLVHYLPVSPWQEVACCGRH